MNRYISLIFIVAISTTAFAQKNTIQRAIEDELKRNMNELRLDTLNRPFYISCTIQDVKMNSIAASMGSIITSLEVPSRGKSDRVLVGGYDFNDESIDNNLFSSPEANDIAVPLDDDYLGIRRALWTSIDNVYKSAARQFAQNKATLEDQKKPLEEIPHRRFAKLDPVQISIEFNPPAFDRAKWEQNLRVLSQRFIHTEYPASTLVFSYINGYTYFISSEGTSIKTPVNQAFIQASVYGRDAEGEIIYTQQVWSGRTPDDLPTLSTLESDVDQIITKLDATSKTSKFEEEYSGPVLFEGPVVADIFSNIFFGGREMLAFNNDIQSLSGMRMERTSSMESKIGKSIASNTLTVKALSRMKKYNGIDLLGAFDADSEGTVPPEELTLIDKGVLKDMLNDRTITSPNQTPNGHRDGPGVIKASVSDAISAAELRKRLLSQAKEAGLDYALIVRDASAGRLGIFTVIKVDVNTGKEEALRNAMFSGLSLKSLKKLSASSEEAMHNVLSFQGNPGFTSYIVPNSLLLNDVDIASADLPSFKEEEIVKSPLAK